MKNEKIEIRVSSKEKEVIGKLAADFDKTTTQIIREALYAYIWSQYPDYEAVKMTKDLMM